MAARSACAYDDLGFHSELLVEAIDAAVRADDREYAEQVFDRLQARASAAGSPRALAAPARSRALLSEGKQAETLYLESIERFEATSQRIRLARA